LGLSTSASQGKSLEGVWNGRGKCPTAACVYPLSTAIDAYAPLIGVMFNAACVPITCC